MKHIIINGPHYYNLLRARVQGSAFEIDGAYQFQHPYIDKYVIQIIASTGMGWEHVSVTLRDKSKKGAPFVERTPTWQEMCWCKDLFWEDSEVVIQYHPAKSEYVNNHKYCLHLWKQVSVEFPVPDKLMVGI